MSGQGIGTDETNKNIRARGVNISITMSLQVTDKATVKPTHPSRGVNVTTPQKSQGQKSPLPIRKREHRPSLPTLQLVIPRLTLATLSQKQRRQFTMNRMRGHGPNNTQTKTFFTRPVTNNSETGSPNDKWQPRLTFLEIENKMAIEAIQPHRTTSHRKRYHSDKKGMKSPISPTNKRAKQTGTHSPKNTQQYPFNRGGQEIERVANLQLAIQTCRNKYPVKERSQGQFIMNETIGQGPNNTQTKTLFTRPVTNNSETGSPNDKWQPRLTFLEIENKMAIEANQPRRTTSPKKRFHSDKDRMKSPILPTNKQAKQMGTHSPKNTQQTPNNRRGQEIRTGRKRSNSNPKHVVINTPSRKKRLLWAGATPHSKLFSQGRNLQVRVNNQQVKTGNSSLQDGTSATDPITKPINENMDRLVGKERNSGTTQPMTIQEANKIMYFDNVPTHFLAHFNATLKVEII